MHGGNGEPPSARDIHSIKFSCAMERDVWVAECGSAQASQVDGLQGKGREVPSGGSRAVRQDASFNGQKGGDGLLKTRSRAASPPVNARVLGNEHPSG